MTPIKPALTAEEWATALREMAEAREHAIGHGAMPCPDCPTIETMGPLVQSMKRRDYVAALCLHGQPFGFTREDVRVVRAAIQFTLDTGEPLDNKLHLLADRIEALLPPDGS